MLQWIIVRTYVKARIMLVSFGKNASIGVFSLANYMNLWIFIFYCSLRMSTYQSLFNTAERRQRCVFLLLNTWLTIPVKSGKKKLKRRHVAIVQHKWKVQLLFGLFSFKEINGHIHQLWSDEESGGHLQTQSDKAVDQHLREKIQRY